MPSITILLPSVVAGLLGSVSLALWKKLKQQQRKKRRSQPGAANLDFRALLSDRPDVPDSALSFLAEYTSIKDLDKLRKAVLAVSAKVKAEQHVYRCVQSLSYLQPKVQRHPAYTKLLAALLRSQNNSAGPGAAAAGAAPVRVADIGCCFGQDVRRLLVDGVPPTNILAVDIHNGYWQAGKELFLDDSLPSSQIASVPTLFADMAAPLSSGGIDAQLATLGYLGSFSFAYCLAVLHVLGKEQVTAMLRRVQSLLVPGEGVLFGWTLGSEEPREWSRTVDNFGPRFLHSAESLTKLFQELGYVDVWVKVVTTSNGLEEARGVLEWVHARGLQRLAFHARRRSA